MKKHIIFFSLCSIIGCTPAYLVPHNTPIATIKANHIGNHPSKTSIDIFSKPKCDKRFYLGKIADMGTNFSLKQSAVATIEANKVIYFSGSRDWIINGTNLQVSCNVMFSFTPEEDATYYMKIIQVGTGPGIGSGMCLVNVFDAKTKKTPHDIATYKIDRVCTGDAIN